MPSFVLRAAALTARILPPGFRQALYRLGPVTRSLRRLLNRSAPEGILPVTIAAGEHGLVATVLGPLEQILARDRAELFMPHHATCPHAEAWKR